MGLSRRQSLLNVMGASTTEDDDIEERVGAETVRAVDGHTGGLTGSIQTRDDLVLAVLIKMNNQQMSDVGSVTKY